MFELFPYIKRFLRVILLLSAVVGLVVWLVFFYGAGEPIYNGTFI